MEGPNSGLDQTISDKIETTTLIMIRLIQSTFFFITTNFYFIGSVTLSDPSNICGRCVEPGIVVRLLCYGNNTGATGGNILIWNTPVSEIESVIILFLVSRLFWTVYICIYTCMWLCPFYTIVCDV